MMAQLRSACLVEASVALVVAMLVAATLRPVEAQDLSGQPIKLIVGGTAGGATDVMAHLVAQKISESLRTTVDIANRPGDAFLPALRDLTAATADGHTLLFMSTSTLLGGKYSNRCEVRSKNNGRKNSRPPGA